MGILDKKTRFIDLVITEEGRRQLANGGLDASFASLSDVNAFYDKNSSDDVDKRLYFEVLERPENRIVPQKNDKGKLFIDLDSSYSVIDNQLFVSNPTQEDVNSIIAVTGSQFQSTFANELPNSIFRNFKNNYFLKSDIKDRPNYFELSKENITFKITNRVPFQGGPLKEVINVNDAEPFFLDPHLTFFDAYQFLPPINTDGSPYGNYRDLRSRTKETWAQIKQRLGEDHFKKEDFSKDDEHDLNLAGNITGDSGADTRLLLENGKLPVPKSLPIDSETVKFVKTSVDNNFILQIYENSSESKLTKLDIIDAGVFIDNSDPNKRYEKRVFYVGKVFNDDSKIPTYINIFTIVMD